MWAAPANAAAVAAASPISASIGDIRHIVIEPRRGWSSGGGIGLVTAGSGW